jgi:hypothetical protein
MRSIRRATAALLRSDGPYMTPGSVAGAAILIGLVVAYTFVVGRFAAKTKQP